MNKQFCFLVSLPRAGNTLLGSLLNQNPNICLTPNSILIDVLWELHLLKDKKVFKNFPNTRSYDNIVKNVFNNYYDDFTASTIIDRGMWGTPSNLEQIKMNVTKAPKFIVLYRPVRECLASFVKANESLNMPEEPLMDYYLHDEGMIGRSLYSMQNLISQHEDILFITYEALVTEPKQTVKKICNFLGERYVSIRTNNLDQLTINGVTYDDSILDVPLHEVQSNIVNEQIDVENYLSSHAIQTTNNLDNIEKLLRFH